MRILLTGLCTVHWGRIENGNIGNYYIVETTVRELHRVFPGAELVTTFQLTDDFCRRENITCLDMDIYYSWNEEDLGKAMKDLGIATVYQRTGNLPMSTPFIDEIVKCDLVLDFSGEMWGDHAEPVGENRFLVNLIKDRVAQLLGKPVVLLAGSQGPFVKTQKVVEFAKLVFKEFKLAANREAASGELLKVNGFDTGRTRSFTDPAFLFEPDPEELMSEVYKNEQILSPDKRTVGFILCGFNMLEGPYDKEPRRDEEFDQFAELVEHIVDTLDARVVLMSHQNGFEFNPDLKLINGRDYPYARQLYSVVASRGKVNMDDVICVKGPFTPGQTKAIIGKFDMFVSGRIHAFVAAVSQCVPTMIINRGHGGVSHRNIGFARSVGLEEYISDPASVDDMKNKVTLCWNNRVELRQTLEERIPNVKKTARELFDALNDVIS